MKWENASQRNIRLPVEQAGEKERQEKGRQWLFSNKSLNVQWVVSAWLSKYSKNTLFKLMYAKAHKICVLCIFYVQSFQQKKKWRLLKNWAAEM